jgi:hypothetical protein
MALQQHNPRAHLHRTRRNRQATRSAANYQNICF